MSAITPEACISYPRRVSRKSAKRAHLISMISKRTRKYTWNMEFVGLPQNTNGEDLEELKVEAKTKRTKEFNQNNKNRHIKSTKI